MLLQASPPLPQPQQGAAGNGVRMAAHAMKICVPGLLGIDEPDSGAVAVGSSGSSSSSNNNSAREPGAGGGGGSGMMRSPPYTPPTTAHSTKYRYESHVGSGSRGSVFTVLSNVDRHTYAVKIKQVLDPSEKEKEEREIDNIDRLKHYACLRFVEKCWYDAYLLIFTEYCRGGSLRFQLKENIHLVQKEVGHIAMQLVAGLHHMHSKNILHRDIKPDNVFLNTSGEVKFGDFGLSNTYVSLTCSSGGETICGTAEYFAPELCLRRPYGKGADLWSLGVLLYECMTGVRPFTGPNYESLFHSIAFSTPAPIRSYFCGEDDCPYDPRLVDMVESLLQKDPKQRPSCSSLLCSSYMLEMLWNFIVFHNRDNERLFASMNGVEEQLETMESFQERDAEVSGYVVIARETRGRQLSPSSLSTTITSPSSASAGGGGGGGSSSTTVFNCRRICLTEFYMEISTVAGNDRIGTAAAGGVGEDNNCSSSGQLLFSTPPLQTSANGGAAAPFVRRSTAAALMAEENNNGVLSVETLSPRFFSANLGPTGAGNTGSGAGTACGLPPLVNAPRRSLPPPITASPPLCESPEKSQRKSHNPRVVMSPRQQQQQQHPCAHPPHQQSGVGIGTVEDIDEAVCRRYQNLAVNNDGGGAFLFSPLPPNYLPNNNGLPSGGGCYSGPTLSRSPVRMATPTSFHFESPSRRRRQPLRASPSGFGGDRCEPDGSARSKRAPLSEVFILSSSRTSLTFLYQHKEFRLLSVHAPRWLEAIQTRQKALQAQPTSMSGSPQASGQTGSIFSPSHSASMSCASLSNSVNPMMGCYWPTGNNSVVVVNSSSCNNPAGLGLNARSTPPNMQQYHPAAGGVWGVSPSPGAYGGVGFSISNVQLSPHQHPQQPPVYAEGGMGMMPMYAAPQAQPMVVPAASGLYHHQVPHHHAHPTVQTHMIGKPPPPYHS